MCARYFQHRVDSFLRIILKCKESPIKRLKDHFYRIEFQHRESPYIHAMLWRKDAPLVQDVKEVEVDLIYLH